MSPGSGAGKPAADDERWAELDAGKLIRSAVTEMAGIALRHQRFLRSVVLVSAAHPEVRRRGSRYSRELGEGFARVVLRARDAVRHDDPEAAVRSCFGTVFATVVIRVAYGPGFATAAPVDDEAFVAELRETAVRYLLSDPPA